MVQQCEFDGVNSMTFFALLIPLYYQIKSVERKQANSKFIFVYHKLGWSISTISRLTNTTDLLLPFYRIRSDLSAFKFFKIVNSFQDHSPQVLHIGRCNHGEVICSQ